MCSREIDVANIVFSYWKFSSSIGARAMYFPSHLSMNGIHELTYASLFTHEGIPCPQSILAYG